MNTEIQHYMQQLGQTARTASRAMARADTAMKNSALRQMAVLIEQQADALQAANGKDLNKRVPKVWTAHSSIASPCPTKLSKP